MELLAKGMTNKGIAADLVITVRTVKFHVSSILRKLEAGNRTEAARTAAAASVARVEGMVKDADTGSPIEGAAINVSLLAISTFYLESSQHISV